MDHVHRKPEEAFDQEGLTGYQFPLENDEFEVYLLEVRKGHAHFIVSREIIHVYYILEGEGYFTLHYRG